MTISPMNDRIVVRRLEEKSGGLLVLPEAYRPDSTRCEVVAVGPGRMNEKSGRRVPLDVKPGDIVVIGQYTDLEHDGLVICQEADVRYVER